MISTKKDVGAFYGITDESMCYDKRFFYRLLIELYTSTGLSMTMSDFPTS